MAEELDDGEFWLPSEFLEEEEDDEEKEKMKLKMKKKTTQVCFPADFPYADDGDLGSSVTETESSDEEEQQRRRAAGVGFQTGRTLSKSSSANPKVGMDLGLASSPQSTLCAMRSLSMSSRGSSDGPSQAPSPPSPVEPESDDSWGVLYAAAGQMVRMKRREEKEEEEEDEENRPKSLLGSSGTNGLHSNPAIAQYQMQVTRFQQLKQQQIQQQQRQQKYPGGWSRQGRGRGSVSAGNRRWAPPAQQTPMGSCMTAVFLGGGGKRESGGTGVFLPRRSGAGNPSEPRRKTACSTVLLPARVVQALNLDLEELGARASYPGGFVLDHDAIRARSNAILLRKKASQVGFTSESSRLPPDWTY